MPSKSIIDNTILSYIDLHFEVETVEMLKSHLDFYRR